MNIKPKVITRMKNSNVLKSNLCAKFDKHFGTVERWINQNSKNGPLTSASALEVIKSSLSLTEDQILQREPSKATA